MRADVLAKRRSDELLTEMFKQAIAHAKIDPALIGDICVGTVLPAGATYEARTAALAAGIPESVPVQTINRFCSSGLMATTTISNQIAARPDSGPSSASDEIKSVSRAADALQPMGWTSENVAGDFKISREDMDAFSAMSFQRAERAQQTGAFDDEIVPFTALQKDGSEAGGRKKVVVTKDDGVRPGTTKETLGKIKAAFPQWAPAQTTGGNASQITDGAAAVLLMSRRKAEELGLPVLAKHVTTAVAGVAPRIMGIGPSVAIPKVLAAAGITKEDVDVFEINEAFASIWVTSRATGARQIATGLNALKHRNGKVLVTSMCIGTGMGAAGVFVVD
ncbi:hypothetical protein EVG20_g3119 [Dentipellis fragilis]|uniref:Thiolase N-terminal domain-containing protein n=1 Tax=Dentipellis fragilis TaxID=205917 RepID=A0A4Y9Z5Y9_9AGAM|nr:hypothetical protein EVG20_g3119 [Dentipellis fragilis]